MTGAAARAEPRIVVRECHAKRNGDAAMGEWKRCHVIKPIERLSIVENDPQTRRMDGRLPRVTTPGALYWAENSTIKAISPGCFCAPSRDQSCLLVLHRAMNLHPRLNKNDRARRFFRVFLRARARALRGTHRCPEMCVMRIMRSSCIQYERNRSVQVSPKRDELVEFDLASTWTDSVEILARTLRRALREKRCVARCYI